MTDPLTVKILLQCLLFIISAVSFLLAIRKSRCQEFYSDTPWLLPFGIFIWGDALILAPFWMITAVLFTFLSWVNMGRFLLLFFMIRAAYEVVYWITHQVAKREYIPPLFRHIHWLSANESAILYQLLNMCQVIFCAALLVFSFQ